MLQFDINGLKIEFLRILRNELSYAYDSWKKEVESYMRNSYFKKNKSIEYEFQKETNIIISYLEVNTFVLADSYGTGSFMLDNIPDFQEYRNSKRWNPARHGKAIVGRPAGSYTDVLSGKTRTTSGSFKGVNIEGRRVYTRKKTDERDYYIQPMHPSMAIQLATDWLYKQHLPKAYNNAIKQMNFGKFLIES